MANSGPKIYFACMFNSMTIVSMIVETMPGLCAPWNPASLDMYPFRRLQNPGNQTADGGGRLPMHEREECKRRDHRIGFQLHPSSIDGSKKA